MNEKQKFIKSLKEFAETLPEFVSNNGGEWSVKGFIDTHKNIYTISSDTKIISKILEIQLFPKFREFAESIGYDIILAEKQNWYPDISFVKKNKPAVKFAVDIKTTYRLENKKGLCNGFTLGSHGKYFQNRTSRKNIQFPYGEYKAHLVLGIIYTRSPVGIDETSVQNIHKLHSINSVIGDIIFFAQEKWKIASDKRGSGNTANIGSIKSIDDLIAGNGIFAKFGEEIFDEYWVNYGTFRVRNPDKPEEFKKLTSLKEWLDRGKSRQKSGRQ